MGVQMGASVSIASATVTHGHTETRACRGIYFVAKKICKLQFFSCRQKGRNKHARG